MRPRVLLAVLCSAGMLAALSACSSEAPPASEAAPTSEAAPPSDAGSASTGSSPGPGPSSPPGLARFYDQRITWEACGENECATLAVPVDYDDPGGPTLDLALLRVPAIGERRGALVVNPGGPGASGTEYAAAASFVVTDEVRRAYDVVGFDPRGVGKSAPVECLSDSDIDALVDSDGTPDDAAEVESLVGIAERFARDCSDAEGEFLDHLSTADAARDLDVLRSALGEERLDYLGISYGTHLGSTYAALFPERVGRFVLDGPLPANLDAEQVTLEQARGFEDALRRFAGHCLREGDCPLGDQVDDPDDQAVDAAVARLGSWLRSLDAAPLPGRTPERPLTEGAATYAVLLAMYNPAYDWPELQAALADAFAGDGVRLQALLDSRLKRDESGAYAGNDVEAFFAISCSDRSVSGGAEAAERLGPEWESVAPTIGRYLAWGNLPCASWRAQTQPPVPASKGAPTILVVATTHDPATPLPWGQALVEQLGDAVLLVRDGDGHTAYREGSPCIDEAIDSFLLDGALPEQGVTCPTEG